MTGQECPSVSVEGLKPPGPKGPKLHSADGLRCYYLAWLKHTATPRARCGQHHLRVRCHVSPKSRSRWACRSKTASSAFIVLPKQYGIECDCKDALGVRPVKYIGGIAHGLSSFSGEQSVTCMLAGMATFDQLCMLPCVFESRLHVWSGALLRSRGLDVWLGETFEETLSEAGVPDDSGRRCCNGLESW